MANEPQTHYIPVEAGKWGEMVGTVGRFRHLLLMPPSAEVNKMYDDYLNDFLDKECESDESQRLYAVWSAVRFAELLALKVSQHYVKSVGYTSAQQDIWQRYLHSELCSVGCHLAPIELRLRQIEADAKSLSNLWPE